jgi:dTDP-4-amino-4,6-dideoxygalactose transaminase
MTLFDATSGRKAPAHITVKRPARTEFLPFALPHITETEIDEVVDTLRSGWITTGPKVKRFEREVAEAVGAEYALALSSATAALHLALDAVGVQPRDEVIVPVYTFTSSAAVIVHA